MLLWGGIVGFRDSSSIQPKLFSFACRFWRFNCFAMWDRITRFGLYRSVWFFISHSSLAVYRWNLLKSAQRLNLPQIVCFKKTPNIYWLMHLFFSLKRATFHASSASSGQNGWRWSLLPLLQREHSALRDEKANLLSFHNQKRNNRWAGINCSCSSVFYWGNCW